MSDQPNETPKGFQSPLFAIIAAAKRVRSTAVLIEAFRIEIEREKIADAKAALGYNLQELLAVRERTTEALLALILGGEV